MKKIIVVLCSILMLISISTPIPTYAKDFNDLNIQMNNISPYIEEYIVYDKGEKHIITINRETYALTIDDEIFMPTIEEIPITRTSVDYSTGANLKYEIPWRAASVMIASLIAVVPGLKYQVASAIISAVVSEGSPIFVTYTQYRSKESYYSTYHGMSYKKCICKNIRAYENSISSKNLIYGPVDGGWFDPIRPS